MIRQAENDRLRREEFGTWDGQYHLSVFAGALAPGQAAVDLAPTLWHPHLTNVKYFMLTSPERLVADGFEAGASMPEPHHYDVMIGSDLDADVVERFDACFSDELRNPRKASVLP